MAFFNINDKLNKKAKR